MDLYGSDRTQRAWNAVAADYLDAHGYELVRYPFDRDLADAAITAAGAAVGTGWVLEVGCGPGPLAVHLAGRAAHVGAVDLAPAMLALARARAPQVRPACADGRRLPVRDGAASLVFAWYVLQHVPGPALAAAVAELARPLRPGGVLSVAIHLGGTELVIDSLLGHDVEPIAATLHDLADVEAAFATAGLHIELARSRGPMPGEFDCRRWYAVARRNR